MATYADVTSDTVDAMGGSQGFRFSDLRRMGTLSVKSSPCIHADCPEHPEPTALRLTPAPDQPVRS